MSEEGSKTRVEVEKPGNCRVCSVPTSNRCTSCKSVNYCNREHQKQDWNNHKVDCRPFQVKSCPELGRFLETTRQIRSGEVLFSEHPIVFGPRPEEIVCLGCYRPGPEERCPRCFWPACSTSCSGLADPEHHGSECFILQLGPKKVRLTSDKFFRYEVILPIRCLLLQRRNPKNWKALLEMESHARKRGPNTEAYEHVQDKVVGYLERNFFRTLTQAEMESKTNAKLLSDRSAEVLHKICGIIDVNAMEIRLPNGGALNALYPTAFLMEHSCLPNTRHVFQCHPSKRFRIKISANQDIPRESHITTMYTHALWGTQQRQDHLRSTKYFTCTCKRCRDPSELGTNLSALRCLAPDGDRKICGGTQLPTSPLDSSTVWKCDKCPTSLTSVQVSQLVGMMGEEVDRVQEKRPTIENFETLLDKLRKLLHDNHYHCYSVMHSLVQLYGRRKEGSRERADDAVLRKKMGMCRRLLAITRAIDPTSSRLALYASVVERELASAILALAERKTWAGNELEEKIREARSLLVSGRKSLEPEDADSPGGKLSDAISSKIDEIDSFCEASNISL